MKQIEKIIKPKNLNQNTLIFFGLALTLLSFLDVVLLSVFDFDLLDLKGSISIFLPLIIGFIGLFYIRFDHTNYAFINKINKSINNDWFNSILTILVILGILKFTPILLNWFFFEATFVGEAKEDCTGNGACWVFINVWLERFIYGLYPNEEIWRLNTAFLLLIFTIISAFFVNQKIKKYIISKIIIYYILNKLFLQLHHKCSQLMLLRLVKNIQYVLVERWIIHCLEECIFCCYTTN